MVVILDDLDMHAKYLREIALLQNRLPGRESYPGDLFYQHAHLLERSGQFGPEQGGGSVTVLPVIETDAYASLGLVSTNLMSCTDGHLSFLSSLQAEGIYPAVSEQQSITRIGRVSQSLLQKQLSAQLRMNLESARRERQYAQVGNLVSKTVELSIHQGEIIEHLLRQDLGQHIAPEVQVPLLTLALTPFLQERDTAFIKMHKRKLADGLASSPELQDLTNAALTDISFAEYLPRVVAKRSVFETLCQS